LSSLPSPARAAISAHYDNFLHQDWGSIRAANDQTFDQTFDSHAIYFVHWLQEECFDDQSLWVTTPKQALTLISAVMEDVHQGHSLRNTHNPSDKTINSYMTSAAEAWRVLTWMMVPLYELGPGKMASMPS
jgi:hypothetical protein